MIPPAALLAALGLAWGNDLPPVASFTALGDDAAQDVVILGETRPIFLRLRAMIGDRSFRAVGADAQRATLARFDRDGDGKVTLAEAEANGMSLLVGPITASPQPTAGRVRTDVDHSPKDGVISLTEWTEALGGSAGSFRVVADGLTDRRTDALFDHLDRDKDGAITRPELAAAVGSLRQLDRDADEWVGGDEVAVAGGAAPGLPTVMGGMGRTARDPGVPAVLTLAAGESPLRLIRALLKKYDTGSSRAAGKPDSRLSPAEFAIPAPAFTAADTNGDGLLTTEELRKYLATNPTDAVLDVALATDPAGPAQVVVRASDGSAPVGLIVRQRAGDLVEVEVGQVRLDIQVDATAGAIAATRQTLHAQFNVADTSGDGYLEATELNQDNGQVSLLGSLFATFDRDHDGKLYPAELDDAITQQVAATQARLTLTAANEGRALFGLLDLDSNRQLGVREVQNTPARVSACDRDHDGRIVPDEIPHHIHLTLTRGDLAPLLSLPNGNPNAVARQVDRGGMASPPRSAAGPSWFRKMDRNQDGDVSRREFLGTHAQFDRLDRDRDGLLAADEAEAVTPTAAAVPIMPPPPMSAEIKAPAG